MTDTHMCWKCEKDYPADKMVLADFIKNDGDDVCYDCAWLCECGCVIYDVDYSDKTKDWSVSDGWWCMKCGKLEKPFKEGKAWTPKNNE
jgi:hypothetical protein